VIPILKLELRLKI